MRFLFLIIILWGCAKQRVAYKLIREVTAEKYPDANGVILFDSTIVRVHRDGSALYSQHTLIKILSLYGKSKFGEQTFPYATKVGTLKVRMARVITPKNKVIYMKKEAIKDMPYVPMGGTGMKMYLPDVRMVKIIFTHVEVGSCIEYIIDIEQTTPIMKGRFADVILFEGKEPILNKVYKIECPKEFALNYIVKNGSLSFSCDSFADKVTYEWKATHVKQIVEEPLMPHYRDVATTLLLSNIPEWKEISQWYYALSEPMCLPDDKIKNTVLDIVNQKEDTLRAIFNFVSTQVRYLRTEALSREKGIAPSHAPVTLERRWGVCRDKAALCIAMLKEVGIDAYIALLDVSYQTVKEIPIPYFQHAIVAVKKEDGTYHYIDPTMEYTRDYLPAIEQNRDILVCTEDGEDLTYLPYLDIKRNWFLIQNTGIIDAEGNLDATLLMKGDGMMDMSLRSIRYLPTSQCKQLFEQIIKGYAPEATLDTFKIADFKNLTEPLWIEIKYYVPQYAIKKGEEMYLFTESSSALVMGGGLSPVLPWGLEERKYPLYLGFPMRVMTRSEFTLPERYKVKELPTDYRFEDSTILAMFSKKEAEGELISETELFIKEPLIPVKRYKEFKKVIETLEKHSKKEVVLIKK